jgi:ParB-like chromosome segregation protein Spo0J
MKIEQLDIEKLIPYANNARTHDDAQVAQIAASIREFGFNNPVLIDEQSTIIAGHGRVLAARKLDLLKVPCIRLNHLSDTQRKAYVLADNKIALNSGWDEQLLKIEIENLIENEFDIDLTGFDPSEIQFKEIDYSILDDASDSINEQIDDMTAGVRKAIQIEFEPQDYAEAQELVKYWRDAGAYVGYMLMNFLREEKEKSN